MFFNKLKNLFCRKENEWTFILALKNETVCLPDQENTVEIDKIYYRMDDKGVCYKTTMNLIDGWLEGYTQDSTGNFITYWSRNSTKEEYDAYMIKKHWRYKYL